MFVLDGRQLPLDTPFEHDGTSFPSNWLRLATPEERAAIGITEVVEQPRPDDRFYWVSSNADGSWTSVPKDLSSLKLTWATQINQTAWTLLNPSDWMVVRKQEDGTAIDPAWSTYRAAVRTKATDIVSALNAVGTVEDFVLAVCNIEWPKSPEDTTTIIQ